MKPGTTKRPAASTIRSPSNRLWVPTIRSPTMAMSGLVYRPGHEVEEPCVADDEIGGPQALAGGNAARQVGFHEVSSSPAGPPTGFHL